MKVRFLVRWLCLAVCVFFIDLISKNAVIERLWHGQVIYVNDYFNLVHAHNTGAAFSFLAGSSGWQVLFFSAIALLAVAFCIYHLWKNLHQPLVCTALAWIIGGALGNLFDRIMYGYVIDFLDFHFQHWHWPAFNVADMAIVGGALLLLFESFRKPGH